MITTIRYFKEKTHEDYDQYNVQWHENSNRIIYLHIELSMSRQLDFLIYDIENNSALDEDAKMKQKIKLIENLKIKRYCCKMRIITFKQLTDIIK